MKRIIQTLTIVFGLAGALPASDLTSLIGTLNQDTKFTALESFGPAFYYSAREGSNSSAQGGFNDSFFTYRDVLTANIGWKNSLNGGEIGAVVGGPGIKIETLLTKVFPEVSAIIKALSSPRLQKLMEAHFFNVYGGWKSSDGSFDYGYSTGIDIKF